jgi:TATA-binding protein-associated factor
VDLQTRSAGAVAAFVDFCALHGLAQPPEKIVRNLCTFLCQDTERTPTFAFARKQTTGILSFQVLSKTTPPGGKGNAAPGVEIPESGDGSKTKLARRGASLAFDRLSAQFGPRLLDVIPGMWKSMVGGLLSACDTNSASKADELIGKQFGQDVIDSLSVLEAVAPSLHEDLHPRLIALFPVLLNALRSRFAVVRQCAARCFATVCNVLTMEGMRYVIENVIPLLGDALSLANRQGAAELVFRE